jgi:hypothetical protein
MRFCDGRYRRVREGRGGEGCCRFGLPCDMRYQLFAYIRQGRRTERRVGHDRNPFLHTELLESGRGQRRIELNLVAGRHDGDARVGEEGVQ